MSWQELAATSHYQTAVAISQELAAGNVREASEGLGELIEAVARSERRALRSQLIRAMVHVLKWRGQPAKRSASWVVSILQSREEIASIQEEVPSLTRPVVEAMWPYCIKAAIRQAEAEMGQLVTDEALPWAEVFEVDYRLIPVDPA